MGVFFLVGQNWDRTFLPLVCESRIYEYLHKTFTAYVHDFYVQILRFQKLYLTNYPTIHPNCSTRLDYKLFVFASTSSALSLTSAWRWTSGPFDLVAFTP